MSSKERYPIWPSHEAFYIHSMLFNTSSAMQACMKAIKYIEAISEGKVGEQEIKDELLDNLHSLINHSGAIARYFFPSRDSPSKSKSGQKNIHKNRAEDLKSIFQIDETSPLADKRLRNAIEHFDERLDLYLENGIVGHIFPSLILFEPENTDIPHHIFRAFYLKEGIFQILGEQYYVQSIVDEISRIHHMLVDFDKSGSTFSRRNPNKIQ